MTDHLAGVPEARVAAWYRRLAERIALQRVAGQEPLASQFLRHWLDNRDPTSTFRFAPPQHLRTSSYVTSTLRFHRAVFLTEERARFTGGRRDWAGVLPRIQGRAGVTRWDLSRPLEMRYESLVEVGGGLTDLIRIQQTGTPEERDLLTALRGFQLRSRVVVTGARNRNGRIAIEFRSWSAEAVDRYDWDYSEHFTVPNPDFQSRAQDAIRPEDRALTVYHRNAQRLERAGLAAPYDIVSDAWQVTDRNVIDPGEVDPNRRL